MRYNVLVMKQYQRYYSAKQGRLPVYIADLLDICDPVLTFDQSHDHQFNWWFGDAPERGGLLAPPKGGVESTILAASQGGYFSVLLSL